MCRPTPARGLSLALALSAATAGACAGHAKPAAVDENEERIERLATRLRPVAPSKAYPYAFAVGECGPTDHPGMSIYLVDKPDKDVPPHAGYVRVSVFLDDLRSLA